MFDFTDNQLVEKLDTVPEDFRPLYTETDDGKFKLNGADPVVGSAVKAVQGLNKALRASRAEANDAKGRIPDLSSLSGFGTDPTGILEGFNAQLEEARAANKGKGTKATEDAVKAAQEAMANAHTKELEKQNTRNGALQKQLYGVLVGAEATTALAKANALNPALVLPFIEKQVRVTEEDGKFTVRVLDSKGTERFSGTTGDHLTITELVQEMRANSEYGPLFKSDAPQGGGNPPTHSPGRKAPGGTKTAAQKIAAGLDARK
ncbi:hypothetical protein DRQ50_00035 [bacterium]|nr:MAG: hypothetical protein DRQ50_00035 [bacterium]